MRLVDEDLLVPVAWVGGALWASMRGRRRFVLLDQDGYRVHHLEPGARYLVGLGDGVILRCVQVNGREVVDRVDLGDPAVDVDRGRPVVELDRFQRLRAVVPAPDGSPCLWIRDERAAAELFLDPVTGRTWRAEMGGDGRVVRCVAGGLVREDEHGWAAVVHGSPTSSGPGRVVSVCGDHVLVRDARLKDTRWYLAAPERGSGTVPVVVAPGWFTVSAAAGAGLVVAYAVSSDGDQAVWSVECAALMSSGGDPTAWQRSDRHGGTCVVTGTSAEAVPTIRGTGLAAGSYWSGASWLQGVAEPAPIPIQRRLLGGMPCLDIRAGTGRRAVVVCFHGGPDSHELDDLRYGGAYRQLVDAGVDVLVVNYPGSLGFGRDFQILPWRRWSDAIAGTADEIAGHLAQRRHTARVVLGVSFGSWVAAQAAGRLQADSLVLSSPVLTMGAHLAERSTDPAVARWAAERFDATDIERGDRTAATRTCPRTLIVPEHDEVVSARATGIHPLDSVVRVPGAHFPRTPDDADARWRTVVGAVLRSCVSSTGHRG